MSQRRTAPSRLSEGCGLVRIGLALQETARRLCNLRFRRQLLACSTATVTMGLVGTVHGWTKASLVSVTTGSGDVPLTLTQDEYSWIVSLTVLGSMIGSLLTAQLADRIGRKYCLLICSAMFTLGWFITYEATSVPMLYFAQGILGIGVGIARTINPMFVSEVTDIKFRGSLAVLIAANVYSGTLLTYLLRLSLTYTSHLMALAGISLVSILPLMCLRETSYFLMAKGQKTQACKSIAYYKGIEDADEVKFELRALRAEARYELHQESTDELHQQSRDELHQQSRDELHQQFRDELHQQSRDELHQQSESEGLWRPSQSRREAYSDSFWEVVDTEPMSDLNFPSSSDSASQSTSIIHTEVICEVHQQPTGEICLQSSRELHSQPTSELHRPSTSELHRPSTSEIHQSSASEIHRPSTCVKHSQSISELHRLSPSEIHQLSTCELLRPSTSQILPQTRSDLHTQSSVDLGAWADIPETFIGVTKYTCLDKLRAMLQRSNRKALFIMLGLIMAQQLSGNFTATQYLENLIDRKKAFIDLHKAMILVQVVRHASGYTMMIIVTYFGRRTLLILSTIGSCILLFLVAGYLFFDLHMFDNPAISILPFHFLSWYQVLFEVGLGTLPNVLLCELFPTELKGIVGAIVVIFNGIIDFTASKLNQVITDNVESHAIFFIFAISCSLAFLMVFRCVPETKGKTYCEIEALLAGENVNSLNEEVITDDMNIQII